MHNQLSRWKWHGAHTLCKKDLERGDAFFSRRCWNPKIILLAVIVRSIYITSISVNITMFWQFRKWKVLSFRSFVLNGIKIVVVSPFDLLIYLILVVRWITHFSTMCNSFQGFFTCGLYLRPKCLEHVYACVCVYQTKPNELCKNVGST